MGKMLVSWDFWNTIIALLALVVAIYSVWYTRQRDKASLEVVESWWKKPDGNPFFLGFTIFNNSSTAIKITNIELLTKDDKPLHVLKNHEYNDPDSNPDSLFSKFSYNPFFDEEIFETSRFIPSGQEWNLKYYVKSFGNPVKIRITADRPLHRWSKTKTFSVHCMKSN